MVLNKLRVAAKLWLAVAGLVLALLALLAFSAYRSVTMQAEGDVALAAMNQRVEAATRWAGLTEANAARTQALVLSNEPVIEAAFKDVMAATSSQISVLQKRIEDTDLSPQDRAQMQKIAASRKTMVDLRGAARKLKSEGRHEDAMLLVNAQYNPAVTAYLDNLREFVVMQQQALARTQTDIGHATTLTLRIAGVGMLLILVCVVGGATLLIRSILQPLAQANGLAARIAEGDLSTRLQVGRRDEFGDLIRSLLAMSGSLGRMVAQVRRSTDSIAIASAEIATGNNDLAQRTEQTSSDLQHTTSAMAQLTQTMHQSTGSARQASELAANASAVAERGGVAVSQVVATMEDINHSSKKIGDIIGVIDSIAFQTNILALNAAVEAARAGEQGRGFAVVASEVRNLAQRSAQAAREIKALIGASVEKVESGARQVADAGTTMQDIVASVRRVTGMISDITSASTLQSEGISEVNSAVGNLDQMTQQNAALVEQSAAAAESLRDQASQLAQVVATFKIDEQADKSPHAPPLRGSLPPEQLCLKSSAETVYLGVPRLASAHHGIQDAQQFV